MPDHETHEHDVLVIGAGGAGLRAAIEAAAGGLSVGLVCKSLLGKAHTVMAEGGIAAAMANVDDRDSWKVHFADTMRGGQYLNNWRMAELHAKEAPDRVRELEAWGAVFDRTKDGRILQRNFGGHRYPRLAHVGDRTGLEMIRTLQDHGVHQGIDVHMERTIITLLDDGERIAGAFGYDRERGRPSRLQGQGGRARDRRRRPRLQDHQQQLGVHRRRPRAGLRRGRRADGHGVHPVPPDRDGLAAVACRGILVTEGVRGEGGVLRNKRRQALHVRRHPRELQSADRRQRGRGLALHPRATRTRGARRSSSPATTWRAASCARSRRPRQPARRRLPRHRLDQGARPQRGRAHQEEAPEHVPPVQGAGRHRHHRGPDGGRPDHALHHGRRPRRRRLADVDGAGPVRGGRVRGGPARRQSAGRQLAVGPAGVRQAGRRARRQVRPRARRRQHRSAARSTPPSGWRWRRSSAPRPAATPRRPTRFSTSSRT